MTLFSEKIQALKDRIATVIVGLSLINQINFRKTYRNQFSRILLPFFTYLQSSDYIFRLLHNSTFRHGERTFKSNIVNAEKGVAEITIKIDTGRDYNDYCRIDCSTYLFYKDNRFYIPENVRERFRKIVKENVMWDIEERFGDLKGAINKFNREAKWIGYTKFVLYMIALSGWAVAAVLFLMR